MERSNKALVGFCDILGFSTYVRTHSHDDLLNEYLPSFLNLMRSSIHEFGNITREYTKEDIFRKGVVGHVVFSDSVLLYSLADDKYAYENLINAVTRLVARPIRFPFLRVRAGIAYGDFYCDLDNNIYVGKALVEAYDLERKQDWCGGALTESAEAKLKETGAEQCYLIDYDVPVKKGTERHRVINWTLARHTPIDAKNWLEREFAIPADDTQQEVDRKLQNTETFHRHVCVQCRQGNRS